MNIELLKKKINRLVEFCEKSDVRRITTFLNNDYQKLLLDLKFILTNSSGNMDVSPLAEKLKMKGGKTKKSFIAELDQVAQKANLIEKIGNDLMLELLKVYHDGLNNFENEYVPSENWVAMSGRFYALEMDRLKPGSK